MYKMFRFTIIAILSLLYMTSWVESENRIECEDQYYKYRTCRQNSPKNETNEVDEWFPFGQKACEDCITENNLLQQFDRQSCADTTNEVCSFFKLCQDKCYPTYEGCLDEDTAFYVCSYANGLAPAGCIVTCEGFVGDGGGEHKDGSDNGADDPRDSASAAFKSTTGMMTAMSVSAISFVVASGLHS